MKFYDYEILDAADGNLVNVTDGTDIVATVTQAQADGLITDRKRVLDRIAELEEQLSLAKTAASPVSKPSVAVQQPAFVRPPIV